VELEELRNLKISSDHIGTGAHLKRLKCPQSVAAQTEALHIGLKTNSVALSPKVNYTV
jgi:hypothetical protein